MYPKVLIVNSSEVIVTAIDAQQQYIRYLLIDNTPAAYAFYKDGNIAGLISTYYKPSPKAIKMLTGYNTMAQVRENKRILFTTDPNTTPKHLKHRFTR